MEGLEGKLLFLDCISNIKKSTNSELYSRQDIEDKLRILSSPRPTSGKELSRWHRTQQRYTIVRYQTSSILYLRGKNNQPNKRVVAMEDMFDAIRKVHIDQNHCGRTGPYKRISLELHGVTEKICQLFVSHCKICQLKKSRKSIKSLVIKPISSSGYLSRGQVDLIDFSTVFPEQMNLISGFLFIKTTSRNSFAFVLS